MLPLASKPALVVGTPASVSPVGTTVQVLASHTVLRTGPWEVAASARGAGCDPEGGPGSENAGPTATQRLGRPEAVHAMQVASGEAVRGSLPPGPI